jgi:hypothetical protein
LINVNVTVTDAVSGVSAVYAQFLNGSGVQLYQELTSEAGDWFNYTVDVSTLADGSYTVSINATDNLGFWDNETTVDDFGLDRTSPIVTAIEPISSYVTNGSTLYLNVSVTDEHSGVNASAVWVDVSNINNTLGNVSLDRVGISNYWNGSVIVNTTNEGTQDLPVYAYDNVSNLNSSVSLTAGRDFAAPNVTAVTVDQWYLNGSVVTLNASISDDLSGVKNATVNVSAINSTLNEVILERQDGGYWTNTTIVADRGETAELQNLTITAYDNVSNVNDSVNMTVGIYLKLPDLNITDDDLQITYSEPEIQDHSNLTINATVHNTGNDNATDVNVSLYIDEEYNQSINIPLINLSDNSTATLYWIASSGSHNITIMVDPLDAIEELNETNNNATNSTIVKKLVVMDIIYPLNGTDVPRGGYYVNGEYKEDSENIVDDNLTITTRVYNYYNSSDPIPVSFANCSFYWNGSLMGYNETNSTGYCQFSYNKTQNNSGYYNITVNFTINASYSDNHTTNATLNESTNTIKLSIYEIALTKTNTKLVGGQAKYREGDAAILVINVTRDGVLHNVTNMTSYAKRTADVVVAINYYDGTDGIVQVGTGRYYVKTIVNESFNAESIKWTVWVQNNSENVSSAGHAEIDIVASNANLNINVTSESETIEGTNVSIYDANLERRIIKELILLNKSMLKKNGLSKKAALGDNYTIEIGTPTNESLIIRELNLSSSQLNVSPQIITNYTGTEPSEVKEMSSIIAVNISGFTNATLIFPKYINVDTICRCDDWNFSTASGENWICNDTSEYEGFGYNDTHFWFTVDHFTAYAGGQTKNSLMAIWDETDTGVPYANKTKYVDENVTFFANFTSSEGSLISDGNCTIWFNDTGEWYTMDYNGTSYLYEYIKP